jgi:glutaredoxin 3
MNVVLYTKLDCSYCVAAKNLLINRNILWSEKKLDVDFTRNQLLESYPSATTFPVVIVDGFYIGGYSDLLLAVDKHVNESINKSFLTENKD